MFIGVALNFLYRGKLEGPSVCIGVLGMMLMFGVAQHFNFLSYDSFLLSFAAAVGVFAAAMRFPSDRSRWSGFGRISVTRFISFMESPDMF
jgi:hypothetical protein